MLRHLNFVEWPLKAFFVEILTITNISFTCEAICVLNFGLKKIATTYIIGTSLVYRGGRTSDSWISQSLYLRAINGSLTFLAHVWNPVRCASVESGLRVCLPVYCPGFIPDWAHSDICVCVCVWSGWVVRMEWVVWMEWVGGG